MRVVLARREENDEGNAPGKPGHGARSLDWVGPIAPVAHRTERSAPDRKAAGSIPARRTTRSSLGVIFSHPCRSDRCHNPGIGKKYRHTMGLRVGNGLLTRLVRGGIGPKAMRLVTVRGRTTGKEYSTPIWLVEQADGRYWVAVFGETNTVRNARAAGRVTLSRGAVRDDVRLREVPVSERVPFLRARIGLSGSQMLRPYFDATPQSSDADFAAIAPEHTVFKLERV